MNQTNTFLDELFKFLSNNVPQVLQGLIVILLLAFYWGVYNLIVKFVRQNKKYSKKIINFATSTCFFIILFLSFATILIAYSSSLGLAISSLSFLSAAIVFAMQDFFASFFAWIYIQTSDQYSVGDSILITSDTRVVYGTVLDVGVFRTTMLEKVGDGGLDTEMNTGRIITFPNRFVHKHSLSNYTKNHLLIQHKFCFTLEYNQEYSLAKKIINEAVAEVYSMMEENEIKFLDPLLSEDLSYTPKVYSHLGSSGITYTIWFACKLGMKRAVLELYSEKILLAVEKHKLKLAYDTIKIEK
jgi:small-conductance mechanosensitive channel